MPDKMRSLRASKACVQALALLASLSFAAVARAETAAPFVISEGGQAKVVIQTPETPPPIVEFAAQELKSYLEKITGATFSIQKGVAPVAGMGRIVLGDCEEARKAGLDVSALAPDGFYIKQVGDALFLCGRDSLDQPVREVLYIWRNNPRGTAVAVWQLLERYCGVRWLFPGKYGEYVPKDPTLVLPNLSLREEPVMKMRISASVRGADLSAIYGEDTLDKESHLFLCRMGYSTWMMAKSHYFAYEYSASRWVKTHPEYFALGPDGKRVLQFTNQGWGMDFTSPALAHEIALDAIAYFTGQPAASRGLPEVQFEKFGYGRESFAINPGDVSVCDSSPEAQKYRDADGDCSPLLWLYYKRVSDEVALACPGKILSVWSYSYTSKVPTSLNKAPENTRAYIVNSGPLDWVVDKEREAQEKRAKDWYAFSGHKLYLWVNYDPSTPGAVLGGVPGPMNSVMGKWIKDLTPYYDGIYYSNYGDYGLFNAANTYLFYHLAWNPEQSAEALLSDYYAKSYGPAAAEIRGIEQEFEDLMVANLRAGRPKTRSETWEEIYTDDVVKRLQARMAKAVTAAKGTQFEQRVALFQDYYLGTFLAQRKKYFELLNLTDGMVIRAAQATAPIVLDGKMAEPDWRKAELGCLVSIQDHVKRTVETNVRVLYDDKNLYVAFQCQEPEMKRLRTVFTQHDDANVWKDSDAEVFLDPAITHRDFCQILVNAAGVVADIRYRNGEDDLRWESGVQTGIRKEADRWTIEMAIPFASLGIPPPKPGDRWAANFCRDRALNDSQPGERQFLSWSRLVKDQFVLPAGFGQILFTRDGKTEDDALNLITNGDFEAGGAPWTIAGGAVDSEVSWSGKCSVRLQRTKDEDCALLQRFPDKLRPNTEYAVTYYMKVEQIVPDAGKEKYALAGAGCEVAISDKGWFACPSTFVSGTQDWRKYVAWVKIGEKPLPSASLRFRLRDATGRAWIDDVKVREAPAPSPAADPK